MLFRSVQFFNTAGTISDAHISNNSYTSATAAAAAQGQGIHIVAFGNAGSVAHVTRATINQNQVTNIPVGVGIEVQCGNSNAAGPGGSCGTPGSATDRIAITNNTIS